MTYIFNIRKNEERNIFKKISLFSVFIERMKEL